MLIHLLIVMPPFSFSSVAGAAPLRGLEIPHDQYESQIALLTPHEDGTKQSQSCSHSTWSLDELWAAFLWV